MNNKFTFQNIQKIFEQQVNIQIQNLVTKMQKDNIRINCQNFHFQLNFKTQYCVEMSATDPISYRKYENKNVIFSQIPKSSIIASLQNKSPKQLRCKITEQLFEQLDQKDQKHSFIKRKCLRLKFIVSLEYIQPFQQTAILYQIQNYRQVDSMIPHKLSKQDVKEFKRSLAEIQVAIPTGQETQQQIFQCYEVANLNLTYDRIKQERFIISFITYYTFALLGWIFYFGFKQFLVIALLPVGVSVIYLRSHKFLIKTIGLSKGSYRISISGQLTVQSYSQNPNDSFVLHVELNRLKPKKVKLYINSMNCYGYPFNGSVTIESKKEQEVHIKIQKNAKFQPVSLQNIVITIEKVSYFGFCQ